MPIPLRKKVIKQSHIPIMLSQMKRLQPKPVNCLHYLLKQTREIMRQPFHFLVEWVFQQIFIDISEQMDQTSLLCARNRIVTRIEVRDQNPFEATEYLLRRTSVARFGIDECNFLQVRENPHVTTLASNCGFGLVSVDQLACCNFL